MAWGFLGPELYYALTLSGEGIGGDSAGINMMKNPLLNLYNVTAVDANNACVAQICLRAESERQAADWLHYMLLDEMDHDKLMAIHAGIKVLEL